MSLTIGILSWNAHRTLINTLESYKLFGLDKLTDQKVIFFQEIKKSDIEIANKFGYRYIGSSDNIGIAAAYKRLVEDTTSDLFLFLENDWQLITDPNDQIWRGYHLLESGIVDVVRYRHRKYHGFPLWTLQFQGNELSSPQHLLDSIHWLERPDIKFPENIIYSEGWFFARAFNANWTNNPTMFRTEFLKDFVLPKIGTKDAEVDLQPWWQEQEFIVCQGEGLFTHNRIG